MYRPLKIPCLISVFLLLEGIPLASQAGVAMTSEPIGLPGPYATEIPHRPVLIARPNPPAPLRKPKPSPKAPARPSTPPAASADFTCRPGSGGGVLQDHAAQLEQSVNVRFDGASSHEQLEIFGKVINTVRGVQHAKVYRIDLAPNYPQASHTLWRVTLHCTDTFRLAANIKQMLRDIVQAGGRLTLNGVRYAYNPAEVDLLKGVRLGEVSSREIQFVLDRKVAQRQALQNTRPTPVTSTPQAANTNPGGYQDPDQGDAGFD